MRLFFAALTTLVATVTMPAAARAACPGFVASEALRDRAVDAKVHSRKFKGAAAQSAIANLKKGIASAETSATSGSANDRAATLAVIAQLRWNQACVLTYDGVASDGAAAIAIAKASDRDMDAFMASRGSLSEDARVLFENGSTSTATSKAGNPAPVSSKNVGGLVRSVAGGGRASSIASRLTYT